MNYPDWAPDDLVKMYLNLQKSKADFQSQDHDKNDLERYAKDKGFLCWKDFEETRSLESDILKRLLTRTEMKSVWTWVENQNFPFKITANGGMISRFLKGIEDWKKTAKYRGSDRDSDFRDMVHHASSLLRLLKKYRGENQIFSDHSALIPAEFDQKLKKFLRPDLVAKMENKPHFIRLLWMQLLPPIDDILERLKNSVQESDSKLSSRFPTKITAINAFRTYLINELVAYIFHWTGEAQPTIIATFMSVALDDASITADTVRTSEEMKRWKKYLSEDSQ